MVRTVLLPEYWANFVGEPDSIFTTHYYFYLKEGHVPLISYSFCFISVSGGGAGAGAGILPDSM